MGVLTVELRLRLALLDALGVVLPAVDDGEADRALRAFRRRAGLHTAADTIAWLEARSLTTGELMAELRRAVAYRRLRAELGAEAVAQAVAERGGVPAQARLRRFAVADRDEAMATGRALRLGDTSPDDVFPGGVELVTIDHLEPAEAAAVRWAEPGQVLGPIRVEDGYRLVQVAELVADRLDPATQVAVEETALEAWLAERLGRRTITVAVG